MEIGPKTRLDDLLRLHPFLLDALVEINPKFGKLRNPLLRDPCLDEKSKVGGEVGRLHGISKHVYIPIADAQLGFKVVANEGDVHEVPLGLPFDKSDQGRNDQLLSATTHL